MKIFLKLNSFVFVFILAFISFFNFVYADDLPASVNFLIRNGESVLWSGPITLPDLGSVEILDKNNVSHTVDARSVLAMLSSIDIENESFSISNLEFYDSFGSFYIKCISDSALIESCDYWQYAVNDTTPWSSIDNTILSGGENISVYFGLPRRLVLEKTEIISGETINVKAEKYNYTNNTWDILSGVSVGITLPNPDDEWSPIVLDTLSVDDTGNVLITLSDPNTYTIGIVEDFYFPSYALDVLPKLEIVPAPANSSGSISSSSGTIGTFYSSSIGINNTEILEEKVADFDIINAINFLKNTQKENNIASLYKDWAIIALNAYGAHSGLILEDMRDDIYEYLIEYKNESMLLTDNERRAMVLLSLGENPYSFQDMNYIKIIIDAFDGVQFGDKNLVNDDIFALIPLASVGYGVDDEIIKKGIDFIISKQKTNGSWEDSVDLTAAALQALNNFISYPSVGSSILNATYYLKNMQEDDGGWGSVSATAWVLQAMSVLDMNLEKNNKNGSIYLSSKQNKDGGMLVQNEILENRLWATSYTIPAMLDKPWNDIFTKFPKIIIPDNTENKENKEKEIQEEVFVQVVKNKIIEKPIELNSSALTASVLQSDLPVNKNSLGKKVLNLGSGIANFIQSGIHRLFLLLSF